MGCGMADLNEIPKAKIVEINGKLYMTVGGVILYEIERTE